MPIEQQSSSTGNQKLALSHRFIYHIVSKSGSYQICLLGSIFKPTTISKKKNKTQKCRHLFQLGSQNLIMLMLMAPSKHASGLRCCFVAYVMIGCQFLLLMTEHHLPPLHFAVIVIQIHIDKRSVAPSFSFVISTFIWMMAVYVQYRFGLQYVDRKYIQKYKDWKVLQFNSNCLCLNFNTFIFLSVAIFLKC